MGHQEAALQNQRYIGICEFGTGKHINYYSVESVDFTPYLSMCLQVLAQRCLESGLTEVLSTAEPPADGKLSKFIKTLEDGGISLTEPPRYVRYPAINMKREEKPWEVTE